MTFCCYLRIKYVCFFFFCQVRSSDATWSDTRRNLRKDHRWESASLLEREEKEKLFNEHVEALAKKKKEHFRQLLDETSMVTVLSVYMRMCKGRSVRVQAFFFVCAVDHADNYMEGGEEGDQGGPSLH